MKAIALWAMSLGFIGAAGCSTSTTVLEAHHVGGTISGLNGTVILSNNNTGSVAVTQDGAFTFPTALLVSAGYWVGVNTQPPGQQCTVQNANGIVAHSDITDVRVSCAAFGPFTLGGSLSGLGASQGPVVVQNGNDTLTLSANGNFVFPTAAAQFTPFNVTILHQPARVSCAVAGGSGTMPGQNTAPVQITCTSQSEALYTLGGSVAGLSGNVTLSNSNGDSLLVHGNGHFVFPVSMPVGFNYVVTVLTQPSGQICVVQGASGNIIGNVTTVVVLCNNTAPPVYAVGGAVSGLRGTVTLRNTLQDSNDFVSSQFNSTFTFPTRLANGASYNVAVDVQPVGQTCNVVGGDGQVAGQDVTTIQVVCSDDTPISYALGGTVMGLAQWWTVSNFALVLTNTYRNPGSATDSVSVSGSGDFRFPVRLPNGAQYAISVQTQPQDYSCAISGAQNQVRAGTIAGLDVTDIQVVCTPTPGYAVGGTVVGQTGPLALQNNGGDTLQVSADANTFQFGTSMGYQAHYNVTVSQNPPGQTCVVTAASGTMQGDVNNIAISCAHSLTLSGTAVGVDNGVVLQLALDRGVTENLQVRASGAFQFATSLVQGDGYHVTLLAPPVDKQCAVTNSQGAASPASVRSLQITCATPVTLTTNQNAFSVLGQTNFTSELVNGGGTPDPNTLASPIGNAVNGGNVMWLADTGNHRALGFDPNRGTSRSASYLIGQNTFNSAQPASGTQGFDAPQGLAQSGALWVVADSNNNRVLVYPEAPQDNTTPASVALGQSDFDSTLPGCDANSMSAPTAATLAGDGGPLLVADTNNNRVLIFLVAPTNAATMADLVLGQPDFTTCGAPNPIDIAATTLSRPSDVWTDGLRVVVVDQGAHRVLVWNTFPTASGQGADLVLGQTSLTHHAAGTSATAFTAPTHLASNGVQLWLADTGNHRVLTWNSFPTASNVPADLVLGQATLSDANPSCTSMPSATVLCAPQGVALQNNALWVTDTGYNRVLIFQGH